MVEGFLSQLAAGERADLEKLGSVRRYRRGDVLFHQGDDAGAVVVLIDGHVKAVMINDGREVILAFPGPGELLGEFSAIDGEPRSGTVRAVDDVEALVIPGSAFRAFLERRPRIALVLLRSVAARLRDGRPPARRLRHQRRRRARREPSGRPVRPLRRRGRGRDRHRPRDHPGRARRVGGRVARGRRQGDGAAAHARLGQTERRRIIVLDLAALRRYAT